MDKSEQFSIIIALLDKIYAIKGTKGSVKDFEQLVEFLIELKDSYY